MNILVGAILGISIWLFPSVVLPIVRRKIDPYGFQPVWAHTVKGAGIGAYVGLVLALCSNTFSLLSRETFAAAYWLGFFASLWCLPLIPKRFLKENFVGYWIFMMGVGVPFSLSVGGVPMWDSLEIALWVQLWRNGSRCPPGRVPWNDHWNNRRAHPLKQN